MTRAILLGPLAGEPRLIDELTALGVDGPVALITAGYEEAERNDAQFDRWLGGGTRNLGLYGRRLDILESDPDFAAALQRYHAAVAERQALYRARITHALAAVGEVRRRQTGARRTLGSELDEAIGDVRALDETHARDLVSARDAFEDAFPWQERESLAIHRESVAAILRECACIAVGGGHVGVLLECLWLCGVEPALRRQPLLAWSSGCMAASDRVMLLDDSEIAARPAEVVSTGTGAVAGVVVLPDAASRLRTADFDHMATLARRCAPRACVLLDSGERLTCDESGAPDLRAVRIVTIDGGIRSADEAA